MAEETTLVSIDSIIGRIHEIGPCRQRGSGAAGVALAMTAVSALPPAELAAAEQSIAKGVFTH